MNDPHSAADRPAARSGGGTPDLRRRLLDAARRMPADERVPAGFAQRVQRELARSTQPLADAWSDWSRGLWQALVPALGCLALALTLGARPSRGSQNSAGVDLDTPESEAAEIALWQELETPEPEGDL